MSIYTPVLSALLKILSAIVHKKVTSSGLYSNIPLDETGIEIMGIFALSNVHTIVGGGGNMSLLRSTLTFKTLRACLSSLGNKQAYVHFILNELFKIPEIELLISQAFSGKSFSVVFTKDDTLYSSGHCDFTNKTIHIAKELSISNMLSTLLFELCNASNPILDNTLHNSYNDEDSFAFAIEQAEYLTYRKHIALLAILVNNPAFNNALGEIAEDSELFQNEIRTAYTSFDEYWQAANTAHSGKPYSHADFYRRQYQLIVRLPEVYGALASLTPGFLAFKEETNDPLAKFFTSQPAQELLSIIRQNPQAHMILKVCSPATALNLAQKATPTNVQGFKALNAAEQVLFITEFVQRKMRLDTKMAPKCP
ncbi:MAG: hypothetical protein AB7I18_12725 [Candidatus Berkiella sp.]